MKNSLLLKALTISIVFLLASIFGFYSIIIYLDGGYDSHWIFAAIFGCLFLSAIVYRAIVFWMHASRVLAILLALAPMFFSAFSIFALWLFGSNILGALFLISIVGVLLLALVRKLNRT